MQVTIINMASHQVNTGNENESLIGLVFYSRTEPSLTSSNYAALFLFYIVLVNTKIKFFAYIVGFSFYLPSLGVAFCNTITRLLTKNSRKTGIETNHHAHFG